MVFTKGQLNRRRGGAMRQFCSVYECWKVAVEVAKEQTIQLHYTEVINTVQQTVQFYTLVICSIHYTSHMYCTAEVYSTVVQYSSHVYCTT